MINTAYTVGFGIGMGGEMRIGDLSARSGYSRDTIRYYEKLGLLVAAERDYSSGYKIYTGSALDRLLQIRQLKGTGFTLDEIRNLMAGKRSQHPCKELPRQLGEKIARIDSEVAALLQFKARLTVMQAICNGECNAESGIPACVPTAGGARRTCC